MMPIPISIYWILSFCNVQSIDFSFLVDSRNFNRELIFDGTLWCHFIHVANPT